MIKLIKPLYTKLAALLIICSLLPSVGCSTSQGEGFAIYLTRDDIPPVQMPGLSQIALADKPLITVDDVVTYDATTHKIKLTKSAFDLIAKLEVPVRGKSFVICLDQQPRYWGAFWTPISSTSFGGVTIWKPLVSDQPYSIELELGYPSSDFYKGADPRDNPEIMKSLEQAGKLVNTQSDVPSEKLPRSMKGYELYSWLEDGQWQFTLITGTNRNKTLEEIIANSKPLSQDGWVQIHVAGVSAIKTVLSRLPQKEWVSWLGSLRSAQPSQSNAEIELPDPTIVNNLRQYATQRGLNFSVSTPVSH